MRIFIVFALLLLFSFRVRQQDIFEDAAYVQLLRAQYSSGDPSQWEAPVLDAAVRMGFKDIGVLPEVPFPAENPFSEAKKVLGKMLFLTHDFRAQGRYRVLRATTQSSVG